MGYRDRLLDRAAAPAATLLALAALVACGPRGRDARPNVVLVVLDTLRADHVSAYGRKEGTTPNLDALAREGVLYERAMSVSPWTIGSHASMFTGLYPEEHGCDVESPRLDDARETLAERIRGAGYQTLAVTSNGNTAERYGFGQGFDVFVPVFAQSGPCAADVCGRANNRAVEDWLDRRRDAARPFFLFLNYLEPHLPYDPRDPDAAPFLSADADPDEVARMREMTSGMALGVQSGALRLPEQSLARLRELYAGDVRAADRLLGDLVDILRRRDLLDASMLIVTSDHGEHLGEHGRLDHKGNLYQPLLHVPLVIRHPGAYPAGLRVSELVENHRLFDAALAAAGERRPDPLRPPLAVPAGGPRRAFAQFMRAEMFVEEARRLWPNGDFAEFSARYYGVQDGRFKRVVVTWPDGRREARLFDLGADPGETRDVAAEHPERAASLDRELEGVFRTLRT